MAILDSSIINRDLLARIFSKIKISTEHSYKGVPCWEWTAGISKTGYAVLWMLGRQRLAHRTLYQLFVGQVPDGLHCDHLCRTRHCVNPIHIEIVTAKENILRGVGITAEHARATHCKYGHEFTASNTYVHAIGRTCRACARDRYHKHKKYGDRIFKTHCPKGHPYSEENTYHRKDKSGRMCKTCCRATTRRMNANRRARQS